MKQLRKYTGAAGLLWLFVGVFFFGCNAITETGPNDEPVAAGAAALASVGDSVQVAAGGADVYDRPNGSVVDFAPAGSVGLVTRQKTGWIQVDTETPFAGDIFQESALEEIGGGDPPPPPPPPPGSIEHVLVFGCSNASNIADGINAFSTVMTSNGGTPGNRGKTIVTYGEPDSGAGRVFDHVRADLSPEVDAVIALLCHRYDYTGMNRPAARNQDVAYLLGAGDSGSDDYSELELIRRMAINTRGAIDAAGYTSTPLYFMALHDYNPAGSCARVGENLPAALRIGIEQVVSEGLVSEMTYNGAPFKLLTLEQPGDTTTEGCHIAAPGQSKLVQGNPAGGLDDWAAQQ